MSPDAQACRRSRAARKEESTILKDSSSEADWCLDKPKSLCGDGGKETRRSARPPSASMQEARKKDVSHVPFSLSNNTHHFSIFSIGILRRYVP